MTGISPVAVQRSPFEIWVKFKENANFASHFFTEQIVIKMKLRTPGVFQQIKLCIVKL